MINFNKNKILITVLMSVYNQEKYLKKAIESILNQTYSDFYFVIVNDGSTDGSKKIITQYGKKDKRIKVINQKNLGLTRTLNKTLYKIKTKYNAQSKHKSIFNFQFRRQGFEKSC